MTERRPYRPDQLQPLSEADAFGHEDYAAALCRVVKDVDSGFTVGLFAPWGMGKSSILAETVERLNASDDGESTAALVFDVWKYEGDSLRRGFIRELGEKLKALRQIRRVFNLEQHLERLDVDEVHFHPRIRINRWIVVRSLFLAVGAFTVFALAVNESKKLGIAVVGGVAAFVFSLVGQAIRVEEVQITRKRLQDSDEFGRNFETLIKDGLKADRLVVGIDNLDRCSPERVTELLSTIKTFLEPAKTGKKLVFVIAADDDALRRHLITQELASSGGQTTAESRPPTQLDADPRPVGEIRQLVPDDIRDAVDEYLRKFFNGVLRVTEVLDEDIRVFAAGELEDFIASHGYGEEISSELVEWVATALKQNPRRIKQFVNGLELRLQVITERRASDRIHIDPDVLMVAKLAIIEEQWPDRYKELKANPGVLSGWHAEAREAREEEGRDPNHAWNTFLRFSEGTTAHNLDPYLTLQQGEVERRLPRFREFVEALEGGQSAAVDELLSAADVAPEADQYRAEVVPLLRRDLRASYYGAAVGIVQVAIEAKELRPVASAVLPLTLRDGRLREKLTELPFEDLLGSAAELGDSDFNEVVGVELDQFEVESDGSSEQRQQLSQALAAYAGRFDPDIQKRLAGALATESIRRDFGSYVDLAERAPGLIAAAALTDGVTALQEIEGWDVDQPAFRVIKAALTSKNERINDPSEVSALAGAVTKSLFELMSQDPESEAYIDLSTDASQVLLASKIADAPVQELVDRLNTEWSQIPPGLRPAAMDWLAALLTVGGQALQEQHAALLVNRYFAENPSDAVEWSKAQRGEKKVFGKAIDGQLGRLVSNDDESVTQQAAKVVSKLSRGVRKRIVRSGIATAIGQGRFQRAAELLDQEVDLLGEERIAQVEGLIESAEEDGTPELVDAVSRLNPSYLNEDLQNRQASIIGQAGAANVSGWDTAYERISGANNSATKGVLSRVFTHVTEHANEIEQRLDQVKLLAESQEELKPSEVRQLGKVLVEGLQRVIESPADAHNVPAMAQALAKLKKADNDERRGWVTDLIVLERQQSDVTQSEELLKSADALAGSRGKARDEVRDRLDELKNSSGEEAALAERVEAGE